MKAIVCREFGPLSGLTYEDRPEPIAKGDLVVIEAEAIGVNFPDGLLVQGLYQMKPETPFVPGMEVAGRIVEAGPEVKHLKVGDRVAALGTLGGYAERVAAPEAAVMPIGEDMDAGHACALICAYGTSLHALKQRGALQPGETLVVLGAAGATGIAAVQIGVAMGARVIAIASTEDKREMAREAGAVEALGYDNLREDLKLATGGKGVDMVFDPVGGDAFDPLVRSMAPGGRYLVIGFASGEIPTLKTNLALVKEFSLVGVFWGAFTRRTPELQAENMKQLFAWLRDGEIRPEIEGRYPLSTAPQVLERVLGRGATGKIVLVPDDAA